MAQFHLKIAGHVAQVRSLFESTPFYLGAYVTREEAEFSLEITPEDIAFERQFLYEEALQEGFRVRQFPEPFLERAAIQRKMADTLFHRNILLFHGSTVAVDGKAYLFTAKSGTGKSTHTRLWRERFGVRAKMVNDDKPFLQFTDGGILAWGSPWSGKHGLDTNICAPLSGLCILVRGSEDRIRPASAEEVMAMLRYSSCPPLDPDCHPQLEAMLTRLAAQVPLWHMECTKDPKAAAVSSQAMGVTPQLTI